MTVTSRPAPAIPLFSTPITPVRLPAGWPRERYERHNRQIKAMRIATALLSLGTYTPERAGNRHIRMVSAQIGVHPPSNTTCRLVRTLLPKLASSRPREEAAGEALTGEWPDHEIAERVLLAASEAEEIVVIAPNGRRARLVPER
jgi:hypothetical protein